MGERVVNTKVKKFFRRYPREKRERIKKQAPWDLSYGAFIYRIATLRTVSPMRMI